MEASGKVPTYLNLYSEALGHDSALEGAQGGLEAHPAESEVNVPLARPLPPEALQELSSMALMGLYDQILRAHISSNPAKFRISTLESVSRSMVEYFGGLVDGAEWLNGLSNAINLHQARWLESNFVRATREKDTRH